ncbi:hypothetical protein COLU111180_18775 [Cohnella lubricantis]|nr:hypothetical protein [Cohnella lubricantis]
MLCQLLIIGAIEKAVRNPAAADAVYILPMAPDVVEENGQYRLDNISTGP